MKTLAILLAGALLTTACERGAHQDDLIYPEDQKAIDAASAQARATLPTFWAAFDAAPSKQDFTIKAGMPTKTGPAEHIWIQVSGRQGDEISGLLANEPFDIPNLHLRSPVTVTTAQVSDWAYPKGGKLYGHFTTRVLMPQMAADEQAQMKTALAPTPLEQPAP
jgi:uncharacterized protein YegJ (DUF2314 family)